MQIKFDLQHFCCGPKGCEIEIEYGVMADAEEQMQCHKSLNRIILKQNMPNG